MFRLLTFAVCSIALLSQARAERVFAGDGKVFSGIAADDGEGLFVPQTLLSGRIQGFETTIDIGTRLDLGLVANLKGGALGSGLSAFPASDRDDYSVDARVTPGPVWGGLTPYVGIGVSLARDAATFQGIPHLLPYEESGFSIQGVAGIAYELMPGFGAGLEYSYRGAAPASPVASREGDNQTIMMRLDLGLN